MPERKGEQRVLAPAFRGFLDGPQVPREARPIGTPSSAIVEVLRPLRSKVSYWMIDSHLPPPNPHVGVRVGEHTYAAKLVLLRGNRASLAMVSTPSVHEYVDVRLSWQDGSSTTLGARVRTVDTECNIAHLDVINVDRNWAPFMAYLGSRVG